MILTTILILLDQITKILVLKSKINIEVIPNLLSFNYTENRGMVFGLAQGSVYIIGVIALLLCIAIVIYIIREKSKGSKIYFPIYMILAGGIGNVIDRFCRGYVVDFIDTPFIATFNLADTFVVIGTIFLIIMIYKEGHEND